MLGLELPPDAACEQGDDQRVEADSLFGGEAGEVCVEAAGHPHAELSAGFVHLTNGTAFGTIVSTSESAGAALSTPPGPATGVWS